MEAGGTEARLWADHDRLNLLYKAIAYERVKAYHSEGDDRVWSTPALEFELILDPPDGWGPNPP